MHSPVVKTDADGTGTFTIHLNGDLREVLDLLANKGG